jgi:outer membrane protein OmpA-like peptidoglycan-associated protein
VKTQVTNLIAALAAATALSACSSAPNPNLDTATALYNQASNDPDVVKDAPLELQQSREALSRSQELWRSGGDKADIDHYAYLATRRTELAQQTATLKEAQSQVKNADAMRAQALLAVRTEEATQARQQAQQATTEAERARNQAAQLQQQLATTTPTVLTLGSGILFDVNRAELKPGVYDSIRQIATFLKQHPDRTVTIEGYTDSTGSADYNLRLSQLRADAMRYALLKEGVAPDRVIARGMGESEPVASNETEAGRQINRRVQVAISESGTNTPAASAGSSGGTAAPTY